MSSQSAIDLRNLKVALIEYARGRPLIWDRKIVCSKKDREDAWLLFSEGFNLPVQEVKKRWEGMRKMYFHELRVLLKTGRKSDWIYFSKLDSFLRKPVERLMKTFSVSKGAVDSDCIVISNDDSNESPSSTRAAETVGLKQHVKDPIEVCHSSNKAPEENVKSRQVFSINPDKSVSLTSEQPKVTSQLGVQEFSENQIAIKPEMGMVVSSINKEVQEFSENQIAIKPEMGMVVSSINKEVDVFVLNTKPSNADKHENEVAPLKKSTSTEPEKNASLPLRLNTAEEIRDELRKIPPIKLTLLDCRPLKPKYLDVSKSKIKNTNGPRSNKSRLPPRSDQSWKHCKPKPCPLSKKSKLGSKRPALADPTQLCDPTQSDNPSVDRRLTRSSPKNPPQVCLAEDISEYATVSTPEDQPDVVEPAKKKKKKKNNKKEESSWFKDKMSEWRQEAVKLSSDNDVSLKDETLTESRKYFLLSFLPDMDEMSSEQRKFFKSKLMNLICHQ